MGYSDRAIEYTRIPVDSHVRIAERLTFVYLDYCQVVQDRTGVLALYAEDEKAVRKAVQVPSGSIAVVMLGPGTSITQRAAATLAESGATVMFAGGGGFPVYTTAAALTSSARWSQAQARLWADPESRLEAARSLYRARFGDSPALDSLRSIRQLRGLEGRLVRDQYQRLAKQSGVKGFKRDSQGTDPVNIGLNLGNSILYGVAGSVCSSFGLHPALGIIHHGNVRAFLFDLADIYKHTITIPVAFAAHREDDPAAFVRREVRNRLDRERVLPDMVTVVTELFGPFVSAAEGDLLLDDEGLVPGHTNYESER